MKLAAILGAWLLATGCVSNVPFMKIVRQQNDRWYRATCRYPSPYSIELAKAPVACLGHPDVYGCYRGGYIDISTKAVKDELLKKTILHELGHAMSVGHVPSYHGVMAEVVPYATDHITQADIDLVCEGRDCPCQHPEKP